MRSQLEPASIFAIDTDNSRRSPTLIGDLVMDNTEQIFAAAHDEIHLPAQAACVARRIAFGINSGKPVRRLRHGERLWPAEHEGEARSPTGETEGGYSEHAGTAIKSHD